MRQDWCLMAALCLLVTLIAVAMATDGDTGPGPLRTTTLSALENGHRLSSQKMGPEYEQRTTGSNFSVTAAGTGHLHVLLSSPDQERQVLKPSVTVTRDGIVQMPPDTLNENKTSIIAASPYDHDEDHGTGRLLVAVARTLVTTTASTSTVTVLSTCHDDDGFPPACPTGRRKRKRVPFREANSEAGLDSSIGSGPELDDKLVERTGRLILWRSSITTVIIRVTSTTPTPIVTALFPCSFVGIVLCV